MEKCMKQFSKILMLFGMALLTITSCSHKPVLPSAEVNYISGNNETLTMRAVGTGVDEETAIIDAEQKCFSVLLFRGLPESAQKTPLVGSNEQSERAKNPLYFNEFYDKKRYKTFIMSTIPVSGPAEAVDGNEMMTVDVKINLAALRLDLETLNVIRKFGY